jgi:hypothetical protein
MLALVAEGLGPREISERLAVPEDALIAWLDG